MPAKKGAQMRPVTVFLPPAYVEAMEDLIRKRVFLSPSELVREAVRELLLQYGYLKVVREAPQEGGVEARVERRPHGMEEACARLEAICDAEPWICLSRGLLRKYARLSTIQQCLNYKFEFGFREDFIRAMARDVAHYIASMCRRRITVSVGAVLRAAGIPPAHVVHNVVAIAMRKLPGEELDTVIRKFTFECAALREAACDAGLETLRYAYSAMKRDVEGAKAHYMRFKHCLHT